MSEVFLKIVNMSISAGWLVLAVLVLRLILKKAPKWVNVLLWGIVAVRLICPISIESALSLIPSPETISPEIMTDWTPEITTGIPALNGAVNPVISDSFAPNPGDSANPLQILIPVAANLWVLGVVLVLIYTAVSYISLRRKLCTAVILRHNIFQCETVQSPFVLGIVKPKIYLPYSIDGQDRTHVIAHEQAHIRRKDHWWKPLGFLLLTIHWFNPLMWVAYILLCRDIEFACDEKVIKELGNEQRADYTQALVVCSVNRRTIAACPLAFGEVGVKERVRNVMNYRKPAFWVMATAVVACIAVAVCFLTNPKPSPEFAMSGDNLSDLEPDRIVDWIVRFQQIDNSNVYVNADNFGLTVDSDFNWAYDQTIRYFYYEDHESLSAQLWIFPEEQEYYITQPTEWIEQNRIFLLRHYLDALKYLPQEELRALAPADRYLIEFADGGIPSDYDRVITYSSDGVGETGGWYIHLRVLPQHTAEDGYTGISGEMVELFYGDRDGNRMMQEELPLLRAEILEIHDGYYLVEPVEGSRELNSADKIEVPRENVETTPEPKVGDILLIEYDGQLAETYPARIINVYCISVLKTITLEMIPTDTDLQGIHAGALLLPMEGKTYRYLLADADPEGVTVDALLYSFTENMGFEQIPWAVYSLKEYPNLSVVLMISNSHGSRLCKYSPPGRCSDTALSDAIRAGYVVMEEGIATHGQERWKEFYNLTQQGKAASVTVVHYYTLDPDSCSAEYFEVFDQDYPSLTEYQLSYDGKEYMLSSGSGGELHTKTYEYLMKYDTSEFYSKSHQTPEGRYSYVLTHSNTVTWDDLFHGLVSSQMGAYIDHYSIYMERKA